MHIQKGSIYEKTIFSYVEPSEYARFYTLQNNIFTSIEYRKREKTNKRLDTVFLRFFCKEIAKKIQLPTHTQ